MSNQNTSRRLLCTAVLGSLGLIAYGPTAEASTSSLLAMPSSCADLKASGADMGRNYVLFLASDASKPYIAFCDADGGTYLTLPGGTGRNVSQYANVYGNTIQTTWNRVRFDPATLTVDVGDFRFSTSTGFIPQWNASTVAYGMAGDCANLNSSTGRANVDLSGLPFKVTATWSTQGYYAAGSSTRSSNDQVVNVTGGGYCGNTSVNGPFTLSYVGYGACDAIAAANGPQNREYALYLGMDPNKPYTGYCAEGGTYLTLPGGTGRNFSQYANVYGNTIQTTWNRVRFDPATLTVDVGDFRFSTSTGFIPQWNASTVAYGMAGDCANLNSSTGRANVDLSGLPFKVAATWSTQGYYAAGSSTRSSNDQVVNVTGGGYCGNTSVNGPFTLSYFTP